MTIAELGSIGEFVGSLAVLLTLLYLARQVSQNGESARLNGAQAILHAINDLIQTAASSAEQTRVLISGQHNFAQLNDLEKMQVLTWLFAWLRALEQGHIYHERGLIDDEVWTGHLDHLRASAVTDAMKTYWPARRSIFCASFRQVVDEAMNNPGELKTPVEILGVSNA